ncbi:response regulator [Micromonospora sp. STR1s_5]|nr:response regulator [Micromonospora sp. STR1s_5]
MLSGLHVLVVEDDPTIAMFLCDVIQRAEGTTIGPLSSLREARVFLGTTQQVDAAVLDVNLSDGDITPVLEALRARGTPVVIYTASTDLPQRVRDRHADVVVLHKPVQPGRLIGELRRQMSGRTSTSSTPLSTALG